MSVAPSANEPPLLNILRDLGWSCVRTAWCQHYSKLPSLKPEYRSHLTFFNALDYFLVSSKFRSLTIHFKRSTKVYKLCVCPVQHDRVVQRNGFHASDGHRIEFAFSNGYVNLWRNKCFDQQCVRSLNDKRGTARGDIPYPVQMEAMHAFSKL